MVQWVRLHAPNAGGPGSIPGWGTRSPMHAVTKERVHMPQLSIHMPQLSVRMPQLRHPHAATKSLHAATKSWHAATRIPCAATKTWCSLNKYIHTYIFKKNKSIYTQLHSFKICKSKNFF